MQKKAQQQNIPTDLAFVWNNYNLESIDQIFTKKYAQIISETPLQAMFRISGLVGAELLTRQETFEKYGIEKSELFKIYKKLEQKALGLGVSVEYSDMTVFSEDDYFENDHSDDPHHEKHTETARSDGKNLILEKDLLKAGGIQGRIYDLLHLAFGHMVQWSSSDTDLLLTKEEAWSIGYRNHDGSPDRVVDMMSYYEFEAGMQGIEALHQALDGTEMNQDQKEKILQYFVDYAYADRGYIIQHYRGNHESFQKFWKFGQPIPPRFEIPKVSRFIERHAVEIGLIRDKQK